MISAGGYRSVLRFAACFVSLLMLVSYALSAQADPIPGKAGEGSAIVFDNANDAAVLNGPPDRSFRFEVSRNSRLDYIQTYHWNLAKGTAAPGTVGIKDLKSGKSSTWNSSGFPGQGGVPNAYWKAQPPRIVLAPGVYEVVDSDRDTWSNNKESASCGIAWVQITPVESSPTDLNVHATSDKSNTSSNVSVPKTSEIPAPSSHRPYGFISDYHKVRINALLENQDTQPVHLWSHGEGISPYNRVEVGATRPRPDLQTQTDNSITFWAGRNGRELSTRKWSGNPPVAEGGWLRVVWNGKQLDLMANLPGTVPSGDSSTSEPGSSTRPKNKGNQQQFIERTARDADQALKMDVQLIQENKDLDIDGSGKVDSADARLILRKIVGK